MARPTYLATELGGTLSTMSNLVDRYAYFIVEAVSMSDTVNRRLQ